MHRLSAIIPFLFLVSLAHAQIPGFSLGPKIGYNSNRFTTDFDSIRSDAQGAFQFGAFMRIGKKVYFQPEVNYVIKGGELKIENMGRQVIKLKSVTIPLLFGIKPIDAGFCNIRLMAGPTMTFISGKTLSPSTVISSWPLQSPDDIKESNWSLQMGAGVDIFFLTLDLRYELGVDNLYNGKSDFDLRNNIFNVSLGLKLL